VLSNPLSSYANRAITVYLLICGSAGWSIERPLAKYEARRKLMESGQARKLRRQRAAIHSSLPGTVVPYLRPILPCRPSKGGARRRVHRCFSGSEFRLMGAAPG
jgi:hypothetical protein